MLVCFLYFAAASLRFGLSCLTLIKNYVLVIQAQILESVFKLTGLVDLAVQKIGLKKRN